MIQPHSNKLQIVRYYSKKILIMISLNIKLNLTYTSYHNQAMRQLEQQMFSLRKNLQFLIQILNPNILFPLIIKIECLVLRIIDIRIKVTGSCFLSYPIRKFRKQENKLELIIRIKVIMVRKKESLKYLRILAKDQHRKMLHCSKFMINSSMFTRIKFLTLEINKFS